MPISLTCTSCSRALRVRDELSGKQILCPDCETKLTVPTPDFPPSLPSSFEPPPFPSESEFSEKPLPPDPLQERANDRLPPRPDLDRDFEDDEPMRRGPPPKPSKEFGTINAGIGGGLLMILIGVVWEGIAIALQGFSCYALVFIIVGCVAFVRGLVTRET